MSDEPDSFVPDSFQADEEPDTDYLSEVRSVSEEGWWNRRKYRKKVEKFADTSQHAIQDLTAQSDILTAQTKLSNTHIELTKITHESEVLHERLAFEEETIKSHQENMRQVTAKASAKGLTPPVYEQIEAANQTASHSAELDKQKVTHQTTQEIRKVRQSSVIEIKALRKKERIRLKAYQKEVSIDLQAALAQRLITHETVLGIKRRLQDLIREREEIATARLSADTKNKLLAEQDKVIAAFQENLRDQMERHLLQGGNQQNIRGLDPPDDSPTGN